jgi:hypothetical protein
MLNTSIVDIIQACFLVPEEWNEVIQKKLKLVTINDFDNSKHCFWVINDKFFLTCPLDYYYPELVNQVRRRFPALVDFYRMDVEPPHNVLIHILCKPIMASGAFTSKEQRLKAVVDLIDKYTLGLPPGEYTLVQDLSPEPIQKPRKKKPAKRKRKFTITRRITRSMNRRETRTKPLDSYIST